MTDPSRNWAEALKEMVSVSNPGLVTQEDIARIEDRLDELEELLDELGEAIEERLPSA